MQAGAAPVQSGAESQCRIATLGNPLDEATTLGPMAQLRLAETVRRHNADALAKGAFGHLDPRAFPADKAGTPYLAPQIFTGVDHRMLVMNEETFGPIAPIVTWTEEEDLIRMVNDSEFGLASYVYGRELQHAISVAERIEAGMVGINRGIVSDPSAPFGGMKQSGIGREGARFGLEEFTEVQYLSIDWS